MLGEKLSTVEKIASVVILIGVSLTSAAGADSENNFHACVLISRYSDPDFLIPMLGLIGGRLGFGGIFVYDWMCIYMLDVYLYICISLDVYTKLQE